jgi:CBS domain-containing protein
MTARTILKRKGTDTVTIHDGELIATAVNVLAQENIGALIVTDDVERVMGVLTERDIVRSLANRGAQTLKRTVHELMKSQTATCTLDDNVKDLMQIMTRQRVRHLPVMEDGVLRGIVSIGDLLKHRLEEIETEQQVLRERLMAR